MKINVFVKKALTLCLFVIVISCMLCLSAYAEGECDHTSDVWVMDSENLPTCTESGLKYKVCDVCGEKFGQTEAPALGHVVPEEYVVVEATCQAEGKMTKNCEVCDTEIESITLDITDHVASDWIKNTKKPVTCTTDGEEYKECVHCKMVMDTKSIAKTGHQMVINKAVDPTCTRDGHTEGKVCASCGLVEVAYEIIPGGHTPTSIPAVEATKDAEGKTEGKICSVCGEILLAQQTLPKVSYLWVNILIIAGGALILIAIIVLVIVAALKRGKKIAAAAEALIENASAENPEAEEANADAVAEEANEAPETEEANADAVAEEATPEAEETVEPENIEE